MSNDFIVKKGVREYVIPREIEAQGGDAINAYVAGWEQVDFAHDRGLEVAIELELEPVDFAGRTGTGEDGAFRTDDIREMAASKAEAEGADEETTESGGDG